MNLAPMLPADKWDAAVDLDVNMDAVVPCGAQKDCPDPATRLLGLRHVNNHPCGPVISVPFCARCAAKQHRLAKSYVGSICSGCFTVCETITDLLVYDRPL